MEGLRNFTISVVIIGLLFGGAAIFGDPAPKHPGPKPGWSPHPGADARAAAIADGGPLNNGCPKLAGGCQANSPTDELENELDIREHLDPLDLGYIDPSWSDAEKCLAITSRNACRSYGLLESEDVLP